MSMREIDGTLAMQLWQQAMAALKAGNVDEAERIAGQMNVRSDARLIMEKAHALRQIEGHKEVK